MLSKIEKRISWGSPTDGFLRFAGPHQRFEPMVDESNNVDALVTLLHAAAEVEHVLVLMYLYMANTIPADEGFTPLDYDLKKCWRSTLTAIAREEMGHFMTVQSFLMRLGARPHLERDPFPIHTTLITLPVSLPPLTRTSLAHFIFLEMPTRHSLPREDQEILKKIAMETGVDPEESDRIGAIYAKALAIFEGLSLPEKPRHPKCPVISDWRMQNPRPLICRREFLAESEILLPSTSTREEIMSAVKQITDQGEGLDQSPYFTSHFSRLIQIYLQIDEHLSTIADNRDAHPSIHHYSSWLSVFNIRYRLLLLYIQQYLLDDDDFGTVNRRTIAHWALGEMNNIRIMLGFPELRHVDPDLLFEPPDICVSDVQEGWRALYETLTSSIAICSRDLFNESFQKLMRDCDLVARAAVITKLR